MNRVLLVLVALSTACSNDGLAGTARRGLDRFWALDEVPELHLTLDGEAITSLGRAPKTQVRGRFRYGTVELDEATFRFMQEAGIPRGDAVLWNAVPGWNGTRRITGAEIRAGMASLKELINLLHRLRVVVLVGKNAGRVQSFVPSSYAVLTSAHPSPLVRARWPEKWRGIGRQWSKALHPENL